MAWIRVIDEGEAEGALRDLYERIRASRGKVANILKAHSLHPEALQAHLDLYLALMFRGGGLTRRQRELLATVVSALNRCAYCVRHHSEALQAHVHDEAFVAQAARDYTRLPLDPRDRKMLDYAAKLTRDPEGMGPDDVEALRQEGLSDEEILQITLITSYFNFVNRVALGLGVEFSEAEARGYCY